MGLPPTNLQVLLFCPSTTDMLEAKGGFPLLFPIPVTALLSLQQGLIDEIVI